MPLPTPADLETGTADFARPSSRIIAFAIAVVRSKPLELSIGEYIRLLRQHIAKGRRQDTISAAHRHLDRSSYWRSEYERTKDALKSAQDGSISLLLEIESLKGKRDTTRLTTATKKRKKPDEDVIPYPRSPKRSNRESSPATSGPASDLASLDNLTPVEFSKAGEIGNVLLRCVYHVNAILKHRHEAELSDLAYHVVCAALTIPQVVDQEVRKFAAKDTSDLVSLANTLTVAGRVIKFLLVAFTKLPNNSGGDDVQRKVTYNIVRMFKDLIGGMSLLSEYEMSNAISAELAAASSKKASTSKSKSNAKAPKSAIVKENAVLSMYTTFLTRLIEMIDSKVEANRSIFEGMAYCILDKLGKRLFCAVFGHDRGSGLHAEILQSAQVDKIEDCERTARSPPSDRDLEQVKLEAPYLIHLLNRMMIAAPSQFGVIINEKTGKSKQVSGKPAAKGALAITAKECLQRTLINSIFGMEGVDANDPFMDCLRMPVVGNDAFTMPKIKEPNTQEWFKEEVWRLLGWDILERDFDRSSSDG